jgi:hypothetical protein
MSGRSVVNNGRSRRRKEKRSSPIGDSGAIKAYR